VIFFDDHGTEEEEELLLWLFNAVMGWLVDIFDMLRLLMLLLLLLLMLLVEMILLCMRPPGAMLLILDIDVALEDGILSPEM